MKTTAKIHRPFWLSVIGFALLTTPAFAQKKNPTSKIYIADLEDQSEIVAGRRIDDIRKKSVHNGAFNRLAKTWPYSVLVDALAPPPKFWSPRYSLKFSKDCRRNMN